MKELTRNVYIKNGMLLTKSKYGGHYGERIFDGLREWVPWRSKLAAMFVKGYLIEFRGDERLLYLGAASGTTVSHLSDILDKGVIYAVEYSPKPFSKLLELAKDRDNIIPLLFDASKPWQYSGIVELVDFIYQDIAQKNQIEILRENIRFFLKSNCDFLIMVKARSIDSLEDPNVVFSKVKEDLSRDFKILSTGSLLPFHKDHIFIHGKKIE